MKAYEIITEKRRNPELNPKISGWDRFVELCNNNDVNNLFVSFTQINKLGINPHSEHDTPNGIYSYPASYVLKLKAFAKVPFAGDAEYVNVFAPRAGSNILDINKLSVKDAKSYISKIRSVVSVDMQEVFDETLQMAKDDALVQTTGGKFWNMTRMLVNDDPLVWNNLFRKIGINGVYDSGKGIICENEMTQAVFFSASAIDLIDRFSNTQFTPDELTKKAETGEEKRQFVININKLSDKEQMLRIKFDINTFGVIRNPSYAVQKYAVSISPTSIYKIKNPSEELCKLAISHDPYILRYIANPSANLQMIAAKKDPKKLYHVAHVAEEVQIYLITKNPENIFYIMHPTAKVITMLPPEMLDKVKEYYETAKLHGLTNDAKFYSWINNI